VQSDVNGALFARTIGNARGSDCTPGAVAAVLQQLQAEFGDLLSVQMVAGQEAVESAGMGLLAAVGQGASRGRALDKQPHMVHVAYRNGAVGAPVQAAFVGKGITFDTGGLNLKPTGAIEGMHIDMGGTAAVLGALISTLGCKPAVNVDFVFTLAENSIGPDAVKPLDVVSGLNGKSVEVGNTDAEGRLALADAFTFAQKHAGSTPERIVDVATLTGACVVALGQHAAGLFSNSDALAASLIEAGASVQERLWRMPVFSEHEVEITTGSAHADMKSIGAGREAGASTAAAFLKQYVEQGTEWAHLDIAGPGMVNKDSGVYTEGSSGFAAQSLAAYIRQMEA
jgi:leucyl aminopeptidase